MIRILETVEGSRASANGAHPRPTQRPGTVNAADVDAAGLEKELLRTVRGEVRFDASTRAMYSDGWIELSASADRISHSQRCRGRGTHAGGVPEVWRARLLSWRRHEPSRRDLQCCRRHGFQQIHEPHS